MLDLNSDYAVFALLFNAIVLVHVIGTCIGNCVLGIEQFNMGSAAYSSVKLLKNEA